MRYRRWKIVAAAKLVLLSSSFGQSGVLAQTPDLSDLEKVITAELKETSTPGAAVAVVSGDRTVFLKGFGVASIETHLPITHQTLFSGGGLSRLFTAAALVSLAQEGKIDLNAPAGRYVDGLSPRLGRLTAHQLLSSTAGLKEEHQRHALINDSDLGDRVRSWNDDKFFAEPGRIYSGSHPSYVLAGDAQAVGRLSEAFVHRRVDGVTRPMYRIASYACFGRMSVS